MNQNNTTLDAGISYSYAEYISAYLGLLKNSMFFSTEYLDEETFQLQETLKEQFLNLPELLSAPEAKKEESVHTLLALREKIEDKYRTLIAYQRELTLLLCIRQNDPSFLENYFNNIDLDPTQINSLDFQGLANDCTHYIFDETSGVEKQKRAATILPYIPIKITRANYTSYVGKSIRHIAISNNEESALYLTSILEQIFDGRDYVGYGKHFVDLHLSLEHLNTLTNTEELFEEANLLNETFDSLLEMLENMFRMICTFSNLLVPSSLEFAELTNLHASFFDLYYSIKNILTHSNDKDMLLATLPERLEIIQEELKANYAKACKDDQKTTPMFQLMQTYLSMNIKQTFGFSTAKHSAYGDDVLKVLNNFTVSLKDKLDAMPTAERKYRMQYFISQIPFVMSKENFSAYITQAFSNIKNPNQTLLVASQLTGILEENHFFPTVKEEPVMETSYEEDDEAARFIAAHQDLFKEDDEDPFSFFEEVRGDLTEE